MRSPTPIGLSGVHLCRGRSYEEFEKAMDRDRFMTAHEVVEWGLIDRILEVREDNFPGELPPASNSST